MSSYFCINCLCAGSRDARLLSFLTHLDKAELVIVGRCLYQDCPNAQWVCPPQPKGASVPSSLDSVCRAADVCVCVCVCLCVGTRAYEQKGTKEIALCKTAWCVSPSFLNTDAHTCWNKWSVSPSLLLYQDFGLEQGQRSIPWKYWFFSCVISPFGCGSFSRSWLWLVSLIPNRIFLNYNVRIII